MAVDGSGTFVSIPNYKAIQQQLAMVDDEARKRLRRRIRDAGNEVLADSKSRAASFSHDKFVGGLSISDTKAGVKLVNSSPAAGVKEFAHPGAVALSGKRIGKRVGVPSGESPRSMVPAVKAEEPRVEAEATAAMQEALDTIRG